jgi:transglutaminase-like putative cysteine protease
MAMHYSIHHRTAYHYEDKVSYSHLLAHLTPLDTATQNYISSHLVVSPSPDILNFHLDSIQNNTAFFSVTHPHRDLIIDSHAKVIISERLSPSLDLSPPWEAVRDQLRSSLLSSDLAAVEFSFPSPLGPIHPALAEYARKSFRPGAPILGAAFDLTHRIHRDFRFDNTATTVSTPVIETFEKRAGVCQDFAHLQIACLRSLGLSARYVSGYLRTDAPPGKPRLIGADASHAWVSVYCPVNGWVDLDPTNDVIAGLRHVTVAWGRDYGDVTPLRGVLLGGSEHQLRVGVSVVPLDSEPAATA